MPLLASKVYSLLELLERRERNTPLPARRVTQREWNRSRDEIVKKWIETNRAECLECLPELLTLLLPEERADMVCGLREKRLTAIVVKKWRVGPRGQQVLDRWQEPQGPDFPTSVKNCLQLYKGSDEPRQATVKEDYQALMRLASMSRHSSSDIQSNKKEGTLTGVADRLIEKRSTNDVYWLIRIILKDFGPVVIPRTLIHYTLHPCLSDVLKVRMPFEHAAESLRDSRFALESLPPAGSRERNQLHHSISPRIGVPISRAKFLFGRSFHDILSLARGRRMALERKYDGYFVQIHVDLTKHEPKFHTFSKSGKDAWPVRNDIGLQVIETIKRCLRIGRGDCEIKNNCIIEGELLPWSIEERRILPFNRLNKHFFKWNDSSRRALYSPENLSESLIIVFFDIRMLDGKSLLNSAYEQRRALLKQVVEPVSGLGDISESFDIDFAANNAKESLMHRLAFAFSMRWEGYVMKGYGEPSLDFTGRRDGRFRSCQIKLKKSYIAGLGDTVEFAIVGAHYDPAEGIKTNLGLGGEVWTHFHIACLCNKDAVCRDGAIPEFKILDAISTGLTGKKLVEFIKTTKMRARPRTEFKDWEGKFKFHYDMPLHREMDVLFWPIYVAEMKGFGFERPKNCTYLTIRFPRIIQTRYDYLSSYAPKRITDDVVKEVIDFDKLQEYGQLAMNAPPEPDMAKEVENYIRKLRRADNCKKSSRSFLFVDDKDDFLSEEESEGESGVHSSQLEENWNDPELSLPPRSRLRSQARPRGGPREGVNFVREDSLEHLKFDLDDSNRPRDAIGDALQDITNRRRVLPPHLNINESQFLTSSQPSRFSRPSVETLSTSGRASHYSQDSRADSLTLSEYNDLDYANEPSLYTSPAKTFTKFSLDNLLKRGTQQTSPPTTHPQLPTTGNLTPGTASIGQQPSIVSSSRTRWPLGDYGTSPLAPQVRSSATDNSLHAPHPSQTSATLSIPRYGKDSPTRASGLKRSRESERAGNLNPTSNKRLRAGYTVTDFSPARMENKPQGSSTHRSSPRVLVPRTPALDSSPLQTPQISPPSFRAAFVLADPAIQSSKFKTATILDADIWNAFARDVVLDSVSEGQGDDVDGLYARPRPFHVVLSATSSERKWFATTTRKICKMIRDERLDVYAYVWREGILKWWKRAVRRDGQGAAFEKGLWEAELRRSYVGRIGRIGDDVGILFNDGEKHLICAALPRTDPR